MKHKFLHRVFALLLALAVSLPLAAPAWAAPGDTLNVTITGNNTLNVNEEVTLTANVDGSEATGYDIDWSLDPADTNVLEFSSGSGNLPTIDVRAMAAGTAKVKVTVTETNPATGVDPQTGSAELEITVIDPGAVTGVTLDKTSLSMSPRDSEKLTATVQPTTAGNKRVTWTSTDTTVATVSDTGEVTALGVGNATIRVTTNEGGFYAECAVEVKAVSVTGVTISGYNETDNILILDKIGQSARLNAAVYPPNATDQSMTWSSSNPSVAEIDPISGSVIARGVGEATITVKAGNAIGRCKVEVSGVVLKTTELNLTLDGKTTTPEFAPYGSARGQNGATIQRYWQSDDPLVAAINRSTGTITPRGVGEAYITFTYVVNGTQYDIPQIHVTVTEDMDTIVLGSATAGAPYVFSDIMRQINNTSPYGSLVYITNLMVPTREGVMYYNHVSTDDTGFGVGATERYYYDESAVGQRYMSGLTFVPNSDFNGETTITFTGYTSDRKTYSGKVRLTVTGSGNVTFITRAGEPLTFTASNFSGACRSETGREISCASFTLPDEGKGLFCYGYAGGSYRYEVTEEEQYFTDRAPYLDQVTYLPAEYYIGTFRLPFYGEDTAGASFTGRLNIIVVPNSPEGERRELTCNVLRGTQVDFDRFDFESVCRQILGDTASLSYVRFTPPSSSAGTLYYNYRSANSYDSLVNANTRYYPSRTPRIDKLTFVPSAGRIEPVSIDFEGYSTAGRSFQGTVTIYYRDDGSDGSITYAATSGQAIPFEPSDFNALCQEITGRDLNYITFPYLPDTLEGTLYRNYSSTSSTGTKVTTRDRIARSSLSGVAFAPRSDFTGTVELEFTGYASGTGERFTGLVRIEVTEGNTTLYYTAYTGGSVSFVAEDFNTICRQSTDGRLSYVRFQLPKTTEGTLYYRSSSTSSTKSRVSASTNYYYNTSGSNRLGNVLFTAGSNFTGTVRIEYTGFSTSGARFVGTVEIAVSYLWGTSLDYTTTSLPFTIPGNDLASACSSALDRDLSYILFTSLPTATQGKLYYDYTGYNTGTAVSPSTRYYETRSPYFSRIVFVPKEGYSGTVSLPYTAYDTRGDTISGVINIEVTTPTSSIFTDMGNHMWAISSVEFLNNSGVVGGIGNSRYNPGGDVKRGDFVLMLYRAFDLGSAGTESFDDVPEDSYYAAAIASAKAQNVVPSDYNLFYPEVPITREDAMVYLRNAMRSAGLSVPAGSSSELYAFADYASVSSDARTAVTSMIHLGIIRGDNYGRINPANPISRAEAAAILHRVMTL